MAEVDKTHTADSLAQSLIEARLAAAELGKPFIGYLIDMALAEAKAAPGNGRAKRMRGAGLPARRVAAAAAVQS
jgi:hypothetical protein